MEKYRTVEARFKALLVDGLLLAIPIVALYPIIPTLESPLIALVAWYLFADNIGWLYSVVMHSMFGQTVGKMAFGIRVVDVITEGPISIVQAIRRDIIWIVFNLASFGLTIFYLNDYANAVTSEEITMRDSVMLIVAYGLVAVEIISCLTNEKRRAIHDFIAGTVVIKTEPAAAR